VSVDVGKGQVIALRPPRSGLHHVTVGLGWDPNRTGFTEFDLDASAIALTDEGRAPSREYLVYFNNLSSPRGELRHRGDNLTGDQAGDDEQIDVQLDALSRIITRVVFTVTIHDADYRGQSFGDVQGAYIRVMASDTGRELARYDLTTHAATETAMLFGELYRTHAGWEFRAIGEGRLGSLDGIARHYGLDV
jgi:tellurium resistance protein TerD